ncbi:DHA2 family efflux MFS transporter permease subunit [Nocardia sp. BMG51109]|uniref:DHA2 family efflux MFS transporter permease subunit n=1 Tax=Nocardia sp. BMG51109 TaxID=1056816 RepID=UPI0004675EB0|nr:DHA2 family efflux MFS transporter permease subunit [Nocardia sp. BMG51109]
MDIRKRVAAERELNPWAMLSSLCVGFFLILVDATIVAVAQPNIQQSLGADLNGVVWVSSAYLLAYVCPLLISGRLGDSYGPKQIYQLGLLIFTVASLLCALALSIEMLIVARIVQGVGAALLTPQTMTLINRVFPQEKRGAAMGLWGATLGLGTLAGPLLGGLITGLLGWRWIFYLNLPLGAVALLMAWRFVPDLPRRRHRFDSVSVVLSTVGVASFVFAVHTGNQRHWPVWIWLLMGFGVVMIAYLAIRQRSLADPLIPLSLFRDRNFTVCTIAALCLGFATVAMLTPQMFYLQLVGGMTPIQAALVSTPMAVLAVGLSPVVGRVVDKVHPRYVLGTGFFLFATAILLFAAIAKPGTPVWQLLVVSVLAGMASSCIFGPLSATATRHLPSVAAGAASSMYNTVRQLGGVLGSAAIAASIQMGVSAELAARIGTAERRGAEPLTPPLRSELAEVMSHALLLPAGAFIVATVLAIALHGREQAAAAHATERADAVDVVAG